MESEYRREELGAGILGKYLGEHGKGANLEI
jgi:hypothetical protein